MSCLHDGIFHFLAKAEPCLEKEILKAFKVFDCDGTGKISFENLKVVAGQVGEDITDEELQVCEVQTYSSHALLRERGECVTAGKTGWGIVLCCFAMDKISVSLGPCLRPSFVSVHPLRSNLTWSPNLCYPPGDD